MGATGRLDVKGHAGYEARAPQGTPGVPMAAASQLTSGASLLHNNLASSSTGYIACIHNSLNAGQSKLLLHALASGDRHLEGHGIEEVDASR
eukprot:Skav210435  [mRNA]  locus=scaffold1297:51326:53895:+ [translate_table: standard]